jgi:hypothetical protein
MRVRSFMLWGLGVLSVAGVASADDYNDVTNDLSNSFAAPTFINLTNGTNTITGTTGTGSGSVDLDYFRVHVPPGGKLTAINLVAYDGTRSFIGVESGTTFTDPNTTTQANLLGWVHFTPSLVGTDILDDMGRGAGAQDFTEPLGPGDYSFWIQENSTPLVHYTMSLVLSVPPPVPALPTPFGALLWAGFGLGGVALLARRRDPELEAG